MTEGFITLVVCHLPAHVQYYLVGLGTWEADTMLILLMLPLEVIRHLNPFSFITAYQPNNYNSVSNHTAA